MCRDSCILPGAAATEIELARRLREFSFKETGLDQYAIPKFAESFEMVPKTLAENAGLNAMEIISSLYAKHPSGNTKVGSDFEEGACKDVSPMNIWDLHVTKFFALKYAADAACTVLRVDQIAIDQVNNRQQTKMRMKLSCVFHGVLLITSDFSIYQNYNREIICNFNVTH